MKVPGSKIVPRQGVLGSNHSLTFGLFTQVSGLGPLGPLVMSQIGISQSALEIDVRFHLSLYSCLLLSVTCTCLGGPKRRAENCDCVSITTS